MRMGQVERVASPHQRHYTPITAMHTPTPLSSSRMPYHHHPTTWVHTRRIVPHTSKGPPPTCTRQPQPGDGCGLCRLYGRCFTHAFLPALPCLTHSRRLHRPPGASASAPTKMASLSAPCQVCFLLSFFFLPVFFLSSCCFLSALLPFLLSFLLFDPSVFLSCFPLTCRLCFAFCSYCFPFFSLSYPRCVLVHLWPTAPLLGIDRRRHRRRHSYRRSGFDVAIRSSVCRIWHSPFYCGATGEGGKR